MSGKNVQACVHPRVAVAIAHILFKSLSAFLSCTLSQLNEYITDVQALCQERLSLGYAPSLSAAASLVLGRPIDKRQQCSNWERRPLSQAQVAYAAIDAHVLLKLAESLLDTEE